MKNQSKKTHYKAKARLLKTSGIATIGVTTFGGFFAYQAITNFEEFSSQIQTEEFMVIAPESLKLNPFFAFPLLVASVVFLIIAMKKNKEFMKGKLSFGLLITLAVLYLIYSISVVTMSVIGGAFVGSLIDEITFQPAAKRNYRLADEKHEEELEYNKEKVRILARQRAGRDLNDGSV